MRAETRMPQKVLVVDDEERILQICEYFLRGEGYEVFSSRDAKQALEIAARSSRRCSRASGARVRQKEYDSGAAGQQAGQ